jgi:hypothetical protein
MAAWKLKKRAEMPPFFLAQQVLFHLGLKAKKKSPQGGKD